MPLFNAPREGRRASNSGTAGSSSLNPSMKQTQQRTSSRGGAPANKGSKAPRSLLAVEAAQKMGRWGDRRRDSTTKAASPQATPDVVRGKSVSGVVEKARSTSSVATTKVAAKAQEKEAATQRKPSSDRKQQEAPRAAAEPSSKSSSLRAAEQHEVHPKSGPQNGKVAHDNGGQLKSKTAVSASSGAREAALQKLAKVERAAKREEREKRVKEVVEERDPLKATDMQPLLLGDRRISEAHPDEETVQKLWKVAPVLKKKDYLLKYTPEKSRKWSPPKVSIPEGQSKAFKEKNMDFLCDKWIEPYPKYSGSAVPPKAPDAAPAVGAAEDAAEAELPPSDSDGVELPDQMRLNRLSSKEAMDTTLLETAFRDSWSHRQALHSPVKETEAFKKESGIDQIADKLIRSRQSPPKGLLRFDWYPLEYRATQDKTIGAGALRTLDDVGFVDPYASSGGPEDPLPYRIEKKNEQAELLALHHITKAAEAMKQRLLDRLPFADISWSRQPSFDEGNVNEIFHLKEIKDASGVFDVTESSLNAHERVRLAAGRISQCVQSDDTSKREVNRMTRDIKVMYKAERGDEADGPNVRRSSIWESFTGFPQASSSPGRELGAASAGEEVIYADPERVKRVWAERYSTCCDLLEDEDEQRLHLLHQIVHEVFEQFGGKWSRRLPRTSLLLKLLRKPDAAGLSRAVPNPQALVNKFIMQPCEVVELAHSLFITLVMERFYLFDMRFAESPRLLIEEATATSEWCLATRSLSRMGRISNYLLAVMLESRVPGLLRLLFRLNGLQFFEYRISYMLHMLSWRGQDNYEPQLEFERNTEKLISQCRRRGTAATALASSVGTSAKDVSSSSPFSCNLVPKLTPKDRAFLLRRAQQQLRTLLSNASSCIAMKYNVEAICKLLPFTIEYTANMDKKEDICFRLFDSFLTKAFFCVLGDQKVPTTPQAISLVTSYFEMLAEVLYGLRSPDLLQVINKEEEDISVELSVWSNLRRCLHRGLNLYLCRTVLCFIADLMYLSCLDRAPLLLSEAREMQAVLDRIVIPALREEKVQLLTNVTLDFCWRAAVCLREVFKKTAEETDIDPDTLLPFTLPHRCGLRAGGPWPSLWQSAWEPSYIPWTSDITSSDDYRTKHSTRSLSSPRDEAEAAVDGAPSMKPTKTTTSPRQAPHNSGLNKETEERTAAHSAWNSADTGQRPKKVLFASEEAAETFGTGRFCRAAQELDKIHKFQLQQQQEQEQRQQQQQQTETVPLYKQWKCPVIPCWLPGCKSIIFQGQETGPALENMHYCQECHIASYCSERCRQVHLRLGHSEVCPYFKRPPTFLRFHMLKNQIPRQMKYPILNVFYGLCDINFMLKVHQEDFQPVF